MKLAREVKGNRKRFYNCIGGKRKHKVDVGALLKGAGDLMHRDMREDNILNGFFVSALAGKACP